MRADPAHRRPATPPRRADFLPTAARAWGLTLIFARRAPALLAACVVLLMAADWLFTLPLARAHIGLGGSGDIWRDFGPWRASWLLGAMAARFAAPCVVTGALLLIMLRMFLTGDAPEPRLLRHAGGWASLSAGLLALKLLAWAGGWLAMAIPVLLIVQVGPAATVLALILLAPLIGLALLAVARLALAAPPMAVGLPQPMAESWEITHRRLGQVLGAWLVTAAPLVAGGVILQWWPGAPATAWLLLRLLALLVTGAWTSLLYQAHRLPATLRPDLRPSRNRATRAEPALARQR